MAHLAHRTYRPKPPQHILFGGAATAAKLSPAHLVFMHGLLGNNRNFASLATSMAGLDSDQRLLAEAKTGLTSHTDIIRAGLTAAAPVPKAPEPRVYTSTAFDWRNHGDSGHNPDMSLAGLSEDLTQFLDLYATQLRYEPLKSGKYTNGIECEPVEGASLTRPHVDRLATQGAALVGGETGSSSAAGQGAGTPAEPLPLLLVAHSMGAMALMHWLWREHVNIWAHKIFLAEDSPLAESNVFRNKHYNVIGAVIIDMAPAQRPISFNDTIRIIDFLPEVPLQELHSAQEVEKWLMANGPKDVYNQQNLFQIRYHISNIDFTDPKTPRWRIGLREIIGGLHEILWEEGGIASMQQARDALLVANKRRIAQRKKIWERPTKMNEFPTYFIFGEESQYNNEAAHESIMHRFLKPHIIQLNKADHFMFMRHKSSFMEHLRNICYDAERQAGIV